MDAKTCSRCRLDKSIEEFGHHRGRKDGRQSRCKACANAEATAWTKKNPERRKEQHKRWRAANPDTIKRQSLRRHYGITLEHYNELLAKQDGRCGICRTDSPRGHHNTFNVDHDHETGLIRGLLCWDCNSAVGKLGDTAEALERALVYLKAPLACEA